MEIYKIFIWKTKNARDHGYGLFNEVADDYNQVKVRLLTHTRHISSAHDSCTARGQCIAQCRYRTDTAS